MRRIRLFLAVAAIMLATLVSGSVLPALAQVDYPPEPAPPECDWYPYADYLVDDYWWEYKCVWPPAGWKFVYQVGGYNYPYQV